MAKIPDIETSTRRLGVTPGVHMSASKWGEIGRDAGRTIETVGRDYEYIRRLRERNEAQRQMEAERAARQAERQAEVSRQAKERSTRVNLQQYNTMLTGRIKGSYVTGEDGQQQFVPGAYSKTWQQMRDEDTDSGKLMTQADEECRAAVLEQIKDPEERRMFLDAVELHKAERMNIAAENHARLSAIRAKEETEYLDKAQDSTVQAAEMGDSLSYSHAANRASLDKVVRRWGTSIENQAEILDNPESTIKDIRFKGGDEDGAKAARLYEDIKAVRNSYDSNRITNLTRFAADDAEGSDYMLARAEETIGAMDIDDTQRTALTGLVREARERRDRVRQGKIADFRRQVREEQSRFAADIVKQSIEAAGSREKLQRIVNGLTNTGGQAAKLFGDDPRQLENLTAYVEGKINSIDRGLLSAANNIVDAHKERILGSAVSMYRFGAPEGMNAAQYQQAKMEVMGEIGRYAKLPGADQKAVTEMYSLMERTGDREEQMALGEMDEAFGITRASFNTLNAEDLAAANRAVDAGLAKKTVKVGGMRLENGKTYKPSASTYLQMRRELLASLNGLPENANKLEAARRWLTQRKQGLAADSIDATIRTISANVVGSTMRIRAEQRVQMLFDETEAKLKSIDEQLQGKSDNNSR